MKKNILILVSSLLVLSAKSQNLSLGPTVGFGHSWLNFSENPDATTKFHAAYNLGGKLVYSFVTHWGISADLKFSSEGATLQPTGDDVKYIYRANYIRIPLQGIYFFNELGNPIRPKISLGPSFGFLVGGKIKTEGNGTENTVYKANEVFKGFDFGINAAAGVNIQVGGNKWINTDITYYHGLTNAFDNSGDTKVRNRGLGINVGITFPIGTVKPGNL